jgi:hypothetical protein
MDRLKESLALQDLSSVIINNAFDGIVYYLPINDENNIVIDFEFVFLNDSALKFLTGTKEKYLGKSFLSLFPYAAEDGMYDAFRRTAETGKPSEGIYYYEYGEYRGWYRNSIIKYRDGIIVYFRDVTDQKSLEVEVESKTKELEKLLKEKEILLKEVNHRIKNNLQLLVSMLNLQSNYVEDQTLRDLLNVSCQRIITIATIHQNLYENINDFSINLNKFVREIVRSLLNLYNDHNDKVKMNYEIEDVELSLNYSVNISLIINELITNSLKHAFNGIPAGEI